MALLKDFGELCQSFLDLNTSVNVEEFEQRMKTLTTRLHAHAAVKQMRLMNLLEAGPEVH